MNQPIMIIVKPLKKNALPIILFFLAKKSNVFFGPTRDTTPNINDSLLC